jgi:hypothetical protein
MVYLAHFTVTPWGRGDYCAGIQCGYEFPSIS